MRPGTDRPEADPTADVPLMLARVAALSPGDWVTLRRRGDVVDVVVP
jgi:hypothetical protein